MPQPTWRRNVTLRGRRVSLRTARPGDQAVLEQLRADPEIDHFMGVGADDRPIGLVSFWDRAIPHEAAELSIWIGQGHRDEGNGTEALSLALRYGFTQLSLHKIYLRVLDYNARAIRAYEKVGFRVEGHLREEMNVQGEWHDLIYMGVLEAEFAAAEAGGAAPSGPGARPPGGGAPA